MKKKKRLGVDNSKSTTIHVVGFLEENRKNEDENTWSNNNNLPNLPKSINLQIRKLKLNDYTKQGEKFYVWDFIPLTIKKKNILNVWWTQHIMNWETTTEIADFPSENMAAEEINITSRRDKNC